MQRPWNVAINGAGRIGRLAIRAYFENKHRFPNLRLCAINDPHDIEALAHLLKYDSTHGRFELPIAVFATGLEIASERIPVFSERDPERLPWADHAVDVVLECSGRFKSYQQASRHISSGAKRVVLSCPGGQGVDTTIVLGVNHQRLATALPEIYSIGSCTTNALVPVLAVLDNAFTIADASMVTVHAYTNDQSLVDNHHQDLRRARAAAYSIIPTKTGAASAIAAVLPHLKGKIMGYALRVPTANVSVVDCTLRLDKPVSVKAVRDVFAKAVAADSHAVLALSEQPLVSCDFNHHTASAIIDMPLLEVVGNTLRVVIWYDNEWGYVNRLWDVLQEQYLALAKDVAIANKVDHAAT